MRPFPGGAQSRKKFFPATDSIRARLSWKGLSIAEWIANSGLEEHGLKWVRTEHLLAAHVGDRTALFHRDLSATLEGFRREFGAKEAEEWERFAAFASALMSAVGSLQHVKAPGLGGITDILDRLGEFGGDIEALIRTVLAPSCVVIDEWVSCSGDSRGCGSVFQPSADAAVGAGERSARVPASVVTWRAGRSPGGRNGGIDSSAP